MSSIPPNSPLVCPICGPQSQIPLPGSVTQPTLVIEQYVDALGAFHLHDPNTYTNTYTCSQGHSVTQTQTIVCPQCSQGDL
jgi:hypothetical protein